MAASFTDNTTNPVIIPAGTTITPFTNVVLNETALTAVENVSVILTPGSPSPNNNPADLGTLADPAPGGAPFNSTNHSLTESSVSTGVPTTGTLFLQRLVYTAPVVQDGNYGVVNATIIDNGPTPAVVDPKTIVLETVTKPLIAGIVTAGTQAVASGATLRPFGSVRLTDNNLNFNTQDTATITLTDAAGNPTDADGLLTGVGIGKTGTGTYALVAGTYFTLQNILQGLVFTPTAAAAGATRTTSFALHVDDPVTKLSSDAKTSVQVVGPSPGPQKPLIAGTAGGQTVTSGNAISPFNGVTITDPNPNPQDSATLTVTGGGTLSGAGLAAAGNGIYTVAATTPAALTAILGKIIFAAPALNGQASATSTIKLDVTDNGQTASDSTTTIQETATSPVTPPPPGSRTFKVEDQTTGQTAYLGGSPYDGPQPSSIVRQLILSNTDNLNITPTIANVFIHSGSGTDAIDVSKVNGNNTLDGSTGSNFLVGGTGQDHFFLDDRNATSPIYSTVVNFHSGDDISIFGVDAANTKITTLDNGGTAGYTGLTYDFTQAGKPNARVVIAGFTSGDLSSGRLTPTFGTNPDTPGQPGSGNTYLNIHGN